MKGNLIQDQLPSQSTIPTPINFSHQISVSPGRRQISRSCTHRVGYVELIYNFTTRAYSPNRHNNMDKQDQDAAITKNGSPLSRTLSVDLIGPKLTSLFRKRKRDDSITSTPANPSPSESEGLKSDEEANGTLQKRRKIKTREQEEFEAREKEFDGELPEEYRKFRPAGYRFNLPPKDRPIRIYADGVFDLFHLGHMRQLEQAKKSFPNVQLVCGIPSDKETHKRKGLTVLTDKQRCDTLKHCRWVDEVIPNAPWCVTTEFLREHKIDYVAHDDLPYASADAEDIYMPIKKEGMFLATQRTEGISTSDIITKIIRDYDKYLMRNFARGATRKELNVSWLKKNELEFKKHINDFRTYWMRNRVNFNNVSKDLYFEVREYLRGKKAEALTPSGSSTTLQNDLDDSFRSASPLTEFASKYIVNKNERPLRSIIGNFKDWIGRDDSHDEDLTNEEAGNGSRSNMSDSQPKEEPETPKKVRKIAKPRRKKEA